MYTAERMAGTGRQRPTPDVQEDEREVALALEHSQNPKKKAHHPTAEYGQLLTQVTTGASGGYMKGSSVSGVQNAPTVILNVQSGCTSQDLETMKMCVKELGAQVETIVSSLRSTQTHPSPDLVTSKKQDWESGQENTDERNMGGLQAKYEDWSEMTDDELYVHLHQCDMSDVSDEDIQSLTDEEVYACVVNVLACCSIRTSEDGYGSDTLGIKMRVKARHHIDQKHPPSAETEEIISDVKLKSSIKGGERSANRGTDMLDGVSSKRQINACTTAEGGQHHLNHVRPWKLGDNSSIADRGQLDAAYVETLMEDHSKADSTQNAVYSESLREECTKGGNPDMNADLLLPSPVHPLNGFPGKYLEFTFDLRCIQSRPVRVITRHNVEKTVEIGKLHPLEIVQEVFTFLDSMLTELGPQSDIRFESGFYVAHPDSVSEVLRIDLRDIQNIKVRIKTKLNVELILQITAKKPLAAWSQRIEKFLSDVLLKDS